MEALKNLEEIASGQLIQIEEDTWGKQRERQSTSSRFCSDTVSREALHTKFSLLDIMASWFNCVYQFWNIKRTQIWPF